MRKGPGSMSKVTEMLTTCLKLLWDIHHVLLQKKIEFLTCFRHFIYLILGKPM